MTPKQMVEAEISILRTQAKEKQQHVAGFVKDGLDLMAKVEAGKVQVFQHCASRLESLLKLEGWE